jgi:hypothetical protein
MWPVTSRLAGGLSTACNKMHMHIKSGENRSGWVTKRVRYPIIPDLDSKTRAPRKGPAYKVRRERRRLSHDVDNVVRTSFRPRERASQTRIA